MSSHAPEIGAPSEVTQVGVQRLGAGHGEHDRSQREERGTEVADQERERVAR